MLNLNRLTLVGQLGCKPELRRTDGGAAVCLLSVATNRSYKPAGSDEWKEVVCWHRCVLWKKLADYAATFPVGAKLFLEGPSETREWTDKDGQRRWTTELHVLSLIWLDRPRQAGERDTRPPTDDDAPPEVGERDIPF